MEREGKEVHRKVWEGWKGHGEGGVQRGEDNKHETRWFEEKVGGESWRRGEG